LSIAEIPARFNVAHYLVDARVAEGNGARVAVIAGERRFSYADVQDQANRVANLLRALGGSAAVCYAGDPERTRQTMITDQGKPWIGTSDLLRRMDGYFFYEGRATAC
jgi:acyl-coenzyme A synthetase/AMP-(fatty) acid ligase